MTLDETIRAVQAKLGLNVDGKPGPLTWTAIYQVIVDQGGGATANGGGLVEVGKIADQRSEKVIATLHPIVRPLARALIEKAADQNITIKVIAGLRTYAEQDALYAKGRGAPGSIVTNAKGGFSNHNFGTAFDIGVFDGRNYLPESPTYKAVGALGIDLGLDWGGNWRTIQDEPHFELRPKWAVGLKESDMVAGLRDRMAQNADPFA